MLLYFAANQLGRLKANSPVNRGVFGAPGGTRTPNLLIRSIKNTCSIFSNPYMWGKNDINLLYIGVKNSILSVVSLLSNRIAAGLQRRSMGKDTHPIRLIRQNTAPENRRQNKQGWLRPAIFHQNARLSLQCLLINNIDLLRGLPITIPPWTLSGHLSCHALSL